MFPAQFTVHTDAAGGCGVRVQLGAPLDALLAALAANDPATSALPEAGRAHVPGDDVFARLEAEMVSDALAAAQAQRREQTRDTVTEMLASTGTDGVDTVLSAEAAQELVEWLNRMYVALRMAELDTHVAGDGDGVAVGEAQSAGDLLGFEAEQPQVPMGLAPMLLAALVEELQSALDEVPDLG